MYVGQSNRNAYSRGIEHRAALNNKAENSMLWKHHLDNHINKEPMFKMSVIDKCRNDPLTRQIYESIRIKNIKSDKKLNSKAWFTWSSKWF